MDCPVCKVPLIVVERHRIEIDYCVSCKGLWFDKGEIELLSEMLNINSLDNIEFQLCIESKEKPRLCPRCDTNMDKVSMGDHSSVILDKCTSGDGIWFDSGELSKAITYVTYLISRDKKELINFLGEAIISNKV